MTEEELQRAKAFGYFQFVGDREPPPSKPGWYPMQYAWDAAEEGIFTGAAYWNGKAWETDVPLFGWIDECFDDEEQAADLAWENDSEMNMIYAEERRAKEKAAS